MKKIYNSLKILNYIIKSFIEDLFYYDLFFGQKLNNQQKSILSKIRKDGFYVWKNFLDEKECDLIKDDIEKIIKQKKEFSKTYDESDFRVYGGNFFSQKIDSFNKNEVLNKLSSAFLRIKSTAFFTLSAKILFKKSNLGSGQGWHRDTFKPYQFKAMVYLSDVSKENGPFQILQNTNKKFSLLENFLNYNLPHNKNRFSEEEILKMSSDKKIITFNGNKGDLIIFNSYCIHRGSPLKKGIRYALTNYYFPENYIEKNKKLMISKFNLPLK